MTATMPVLSREYVYVPVQPESEDLTDVTSLPVFFAFLAEDAEPTDEDWVEGSWAPPASVQGLHETYVARRLVGPDSGVVLAAGHWHVWLRIDAAVERPVRSVGVLVVV